MNRTNTLGFAAVLLATVAAAIVLCMLSPWWALPAVLVALALWIAATRGGRQTWSVARVGLATIPQRSGSAAVVMLGIAGVVGVLVAILAIGRGFERTLRQTGSNDTVIMLSTGSPTEAGSSIKDEVLSVIVQAPQILKNSAGLPLVSAEQLMVASLPKKSSGLDANVAMRGVGPNIWELWPHIKILAGRKFTPGLRELMVGKGAQEQFSGLDLGATMKFDGQPWTVVGTFDTGDAHNSEIWGDTGTVGSTYRRTGSVNSLTARLTDAGAVDALRVAVRSDPRLKVDVLTTREFYNRQSEKFARMIAIVGATIGGIMAVGAIFGAINATYTAITRRTREIATLRAFGFRAMPVIVSILLETMILAVLGGLAGAAIAWAVFDGFSAATVGASGQVVFAFDVSADLLWNGLKWALLIGFIGGLFPAVRAARLSITAGLREL